MTTINFPSSPTLDQVYTLGAKSWRWNGTEQAWYPIAGHELRAPLTWSVLPGRGG